MTRKIVIGVTGPNRGGLVAWTMTAFALLRCGAKPVRIRPGESLDESRLDGVVIGGGTDVDPFHYGEEKLAEEADDEDANSSILDWLVGLALTLSRAVFASRSEQDYDPDRDQLEKHMIEYALYQRLPILGICRGAQLMNVVLGGSLHQKIGHFYTERTDNVRSVLPRKTVKVEPDTLLQKILETDSCVVNALHRQSIKELGDEIVVSASEQTGVVQAIERQTHCFFIGVQWHPEYMPQSATQQKLFQQLTRSARHRDRSESIGTDEGRR